MNKAKIGLNRFACKIKNIAVKADERPGIFTVFASLFIAVLLEMLGRHSVVDAVVFVFTHPLRFLVNALIISLTLGVGLFFRRRRFIQAFVIIAWVTLGIVNFLLLSYRVTPLGMIDFTLLTACFEVIHVYFNVFELILLGLVILSIVCLIVMAYIKLPPVKPRFKGAAVFMLLAGMLTFSFYVLVSDEDVIKASFADISGAYDDFGFVYCFSTSAFDRGISQPDNYSERSISRILKKLPDDETPQQLPNVIMVQLESFFDVKYLEDTEFTHDPLPNFTYLRDNYTSGFLTVPSVGAGTANTEFEVLSGMSLDFFGMGEYPYKTILKEKACESMCTVLRDLDYSANAIHNNTATFYDRNKVFAQLGFDTFTSIEYMQNVEYNPIGWAKDMVLVEEIEKALDSDDGQNFVFTISVQGHGKYQKGASDGNVEGVDSVLFDDDDTEAAFEYYVSQIEEMDQFIGELVKMLENRDEPTILVLYGDHLPNFDIGAEELKNGNIFETEYVTWDNLGFFQQDEDLSAYQLSAKVLDMIGIHKGILFKLHQNRESNESYIEDLESLEYDMLYGSSFCYDGRDKYKSTKLKMGVVPITVEDARFDGDTLTVYGENFTQWSEIVINGDAVKTVFVDGNTLTAKASDISPGDTITVRQRTNALIELSESESYIFE